MMVSVRQTLCILVFLAVILTAWQSMAAWPFFAGGLAVLAGLMLHLLYVRPQQISLPEHFWLRMCKGQPLKWISVAVLWWQAMHAYPLQALWVWLGGTCCLLIHGFVWPLLTQKTSMHEGKWP